jgi:hypothetical protein
MIASSAIGLLLPGPAVVHGQATIATLNIAVPLSATSKPVFHGVTVKIPYADSAGTANTLQPIWVGSIDGDGSNDGYPLLAGESVWIPIDDVSKIYINGPQGGWVAYIGA